MSADPTKQGRPVAAPLPEPVADGARPRPQGPPQQEPAASRTQNRSQDLIEQVVRRWHRFVAGGPPEDLDRLLSEDVVFYSPVIYTPQRGKAVTKAYLQAAAVALSGDRMEGQCYYTKQVVAKDVAVLEFETTVAGTHINGVDIIRCDDAGQIVEFRVMVRPLRGVNAVHQQMQTMLAAMTPSPHDGDTSR
jgi:ketosteroid isomerase-like protein